MKKTLLALAAMSVSMSIFAAGCGFAGKAPEKENSTSKPAVTQEQKMQEVEKNMSSARNTPIVKAAKEGWSYGCWNHKQSLGTGLFQQDPAC